MKFPWYETIHDESLEQGDLLDGFPLGIPQSISPDDSGEFPLDEKTLNLVVMTQTCDIEQHKVASILLCSRFDLWQFVDEATRQGKNWGKETREDLRRGNVPGYHLLNDTEQDGLRIGLSVVDFHEVYTSPTEVVRQFVQRTVHRLRLLPPYREHLAQAFARFFMRVGLPIDIPKEKMRARPK